MVLVEISARPAIRRNDEPNQLELLCIGPTISAAINGTVVASVEDEMSAVR
ncbi:MAG: hypothetical protein U0531_18965 [Dehalococcoidia bacterium]